MLAAIEGRESQNPRRGRGSGGADVAPGLGRGAQRLAGRAVHPAGDAGRGGVAACGDGRGCAFCAPTCVPISTRPAPSGVGAAFCLRRAGVFSVSGCFVTVLVRNHELVIEHLASIQAEQALRREAEEQLRLLAESSPAAILTTDGKGIVLAGNQAADATVRHSRRRDACAAATSAHICRCWPTRLRLEVAREGLRTAAQVPGLS